MSVAILMAITLIILALAVLGLVVWVARLSASRALWRRNSWQALGTAKEWRRHYHDLRSRAYVRGDKGRFVRADKV